MSVVLMAPGEMFQGLLAQPGFQFRSEGMSQGRNDLPIEPEEDDPEVERWKFGARLGNERSLLQLEQHYRQLAERGYYGAEENLNEVREVEAVRERERELVP